MAVNLDSGVFSRRITSRWYTYFGWFAIRVRVFLKPSSRSEATVKASSLRMGVLLGAATNMALRRSNNLIAPRSGGSTGPIQSENVGILTNRPVVAELGCARRQVRRRPLQCKRHGGCKRRGIAARNDGAPAAVLQD